MTINMHKSPGGDSPQDNGQQQQSPPGGQQTQPQGQQNVPPQQAPEGKVPVENMVCGFNCLLVGIFSFVT